MSLHRGHIGLACLIIIAAFVCGLGWSNYDGICIKQMRRLSDRELITAAFDAQNRPVIASFERFSGVTLVKIPYAGPDAYEQEFQNCCGPDHVYVDRSPSFFQRLTGQAVAVIGIPYNSRWRHPDGSTVTMTENEIRRLYIISPCGDANDWLR